jgi:protein-S-isoprenylcysteine O-methyltransferase Ste14
MDCHLAHPVAGAHLACVDHQLGRGVVLVRPDRKTGCVLGSAGLQHSDYCGGILFLPWTSEVLGEKPVWHFSNAGIYLFAALTLAGISFTWWARIHLGRFWSNSITRKEGHRVIDTGPYGLVRHPIYTGLIGAILVTGIAVGTVSAMLGAILISLGMAFKARMEEGFLTHELGADAYGPYCRRVPMLIPFLPPR